MVGLIVISDVNDEPAFGPFDGMKLMVVFVVIARGGLGFRKALSKAAALTPISSPSSPEFLAGIKEAAIGELRGTVGGIDGDAWKSARSRCCPPSVERRTHAPKKGLATLLFRDPLMGRQPPRATTVVGKMAGVGERGKCRHEKCAFGRLHHSGVPVIDRTIEERPWKGPRLAIVIRPLHFDPSKRTHVLLPSPGTHDKKLPVCPPGQRWPTVI